MSQSGLAERDCVFVASFTEDNYRQFMQDWEARMNHDLRHGSSLVGVAQEQQRMGQGADGTNG